MTAELPVFAAAAAAAHRRPPVANGLFQRLPLERRLVCHLCARAQRQGLCVGEQ